ncbi:class I mannose-6-phosphate isomerase [Actinophytocola oryzae]|uniref:Mannose-6-phosphate isomerase class I n=1 Tax=Actinophytocola oryzae TaxID=502181 RepID=A0A4R7W673_9PSEU|nr:class I mannose-6-phosphate isomerase [Actinophytocola oryzae]TDV57648.1 mannose-6-phosphate isomerase class I [Actinophytocola oryzae]
MSTSSPYDPLPYYPPVTGAVRLGWASALATLPADARVLAIDGPAVLDWDHVAKAVVAALPGPVDVVDLRTAGLSWAEVERRTRTATLADDPDFEALASGSLADLLDHAKLPTGPVASGVRVLVGPGAALVGDPDVVWWADLPKRFAEAAVGAGTGRNLFAPADVPATTRRLFYVDWPLLDRHRDALADRFDLWLDTREVENPTWLDGPSLRATCAALARRPHRTRPTFNTTPWGGQWGRRSLGHNPDAENSALGYELIAPESGVLVGETPDVGVEVPFQLVVALAPVEVLGQDVHERFGTSFPIRFDYLDTVDGGNLSVHCHPRSTYMREVFGWPYTQHETYYLMLGSEENTVFLGLRDGASVAEFQKAARLANTEAVGFDIGRFVQTFPATPHQLFLIPAGTPHGSGRGNVVLEVSATPYLYSLRFYDWLRRDSGDRQRPVHVDHAFRNLDPERAGAAVSERLVQQPRRVGGGEGWHEELIGALPEMFFEVLRLCVEPGATAEQDTAGRFHVLNVVEGERVILLTENGDEHQLGYAETIVVPAAVGRYTVRGLGGRPARVVKANVTRT